MFKSLFATNKKPNYQEVEWQKQPYPSWLAYEPNLIPPPELMRTEGIDVLEDWFRWAEEWSFILRVWGKATPASHLLEIGCGLGRIAFPLRYILSATGSYQGFEICREKVDFLQKTFHQAYPHFRFIWANIYNTYYNPKGTVKGTEYNFPCPDQSVDLVYAASVFTHMLPDTAAHYFKETARVLKPGGRAVFSFFILDNYMPGRQRPSGFNRPGFNFDHSYKEYGQAFAIAEPDNPEQMTAYRKDLIEDFARQSSLVLTEDPLPGIWSGKYQNWIGAQDLVVLSKV